MAVQAPRCSSSNLIFLNNKRNGKEEEHDLYSLQSQDQSNMLFNNGGYNQRKRRRDKNNHQPPSNMVYTGLHLSSGEDQTRMNSGVLSVSSQDVVAANISRQSQDLDEFLHVQAEDLRRTLAEKRKRQYKALVSTVEGPLIRKLKEKEAEIERATRRHNELMASDAQLKAELEAWQARAKWHEEAVVSLQAQLREAEAVDKRGSGSVPVQDSGVISGLDDEESVYVDPERTRQPRCKCCQKGEATMVLLPCRHLSLCLECDRTALACPVCLTLRNSSVEAILC